MLWRCLGEEFEMTNRKKASPRKFSAETKKHSQVCVTCNKIFPVPLEGIMQGNSCVITSAHGG